MTERKSFDEQLEEAKADVVKLASRIGEQIARATQGILDGDLAVVDTIYSEHAVIAVENHEIEQRAYRIFALQQPIAVDLRMLLAVLRILHELELTAGLMRNVARATRRLYPRQLSPRIRGIIERMGSQAATQMHIAIDAFADNDPIAASALPDMDDVMDELQKDLFRAIFAEGAPDEAALQQAVQITFVGRDYERAADHAVTIARWVRFISTGVLPGDTGDD
ncbi:MAG TPA: phosphate signaling complex protein PhoU [Acidimicrobiia bacterium]